MGQRAYNEMKNVVQKIIELHKNCNFKAHVYPIQCVYMIAFCMGNNDFVIIIKKQGRRYSIMRKY